MEVSWIRKLFPLNVKGLTLLFGVPLFMVLTSVTGLVLCDNDGTCGDLVWEKKIWGSEVGDVGTFCEKDTVDTFLLEQQNTLSNFSFIYFGVIVMFLGILDQFHPPKVGKETFNSHVTNTPFLSVYYGISMFYLGFGSFVFHGRGTGIAYRHDQASIIVHFGVLFALVFLLYVPLDIKHLKEYRIFAICTSLIMVMIILGFSLGDQINSKQATDGTIGLVACLVFSLVVNVVLRYFRGWKVSLLTIGLGIVTMIVFVCAFVVQEQFINVRCFETAKFQPHALWHVFCGIGFFTLYLLFRSDHQNPKQLTPNSNSHNKDQELENDEKERNQEIFDIEKNGASVKEAKITL